MRLFNPPQKPKRYVPAAIKKRGGVSKPTHMLLKNPACIYAFRGKDQGKGVGGTEGLNWEESRTAPETKIRKEAESFAAIGGSRLRKQLEALKEKDTTRLTLI